MVSEIQMYFPQIKVNLTTTSNLSKPAPFQKLRSFNILFGCGLEVSLSDYKMII